MGEKKQAEKSKAKVKEPETVDNSPELEEDKFNVDDLLDEIDGVLEENAEEFVKSYVQKGGE